MITLPGDILRISSFTKFVYNYPNDEFVYHLNDRLLFLEPPDGDVAGKGERKKILNLFKQHGKIKKYLRKINKDPLETIVLKWSDDKQQKKQIKDLLKLLDLRLDRDPEGKYVISDATNDGPAPYFRFLGLDLSAMGSQLNQNQMFYCQLREIEIPLPFDFKFLTDVTGLSLDRDNFLEWMTKNETFSLFLGTLFRLSGSEIDFIDKMEGPSGSSTWRKIYSDRKLLMGLFVLSLALRVDDDGFLLPGGNEAASFWSQLTGADCRQMPYQFLKNLATLYDGKLNYFYTFSFFLPPESQKALFFDFDPEKIRVLVAGAETVKAERLKGSRFPHLSNANFLTLLHTLEVGREGIKFPAGLPAWESALGIQPPPVLPVTDGQDPAVKPVSKDFSFIRQLVTGSDASRPISPLRKFIFLYSKFSNREELLSADVLARAVRHFEDATILIDYLEKIPIRKPETALALFDWWESLKKLNKKDHLLMSAISQSLFECLSQTAHYADETIDYDGLVTAFLAIPLSRLSIWNQLLVYLEKQFKIEPLLRDAHDQFLDFILQGVPNEFLNFRDNTYRFMIRNVYKETLNNIMDTQEISSLTNLIEINDLINRLVKADKMTRLNLIVEIRRAFSTLRHPAIDSRAPSIMKNRVIPYNKAKLDKDLEWLQTVIVNSEDMETIQPILDRLKADCLIYHLKDYFMALVYGLNAKNDNLRIFLNPNLIRLHDFGTAYGRTPWNYCGFPFKRNFPGYHLKGGLSRLNIAFGSAWEHYLVRNKVIFDSEPLRAMVVNILDTYPVQKVDNSMSHIALQIEFGLDLINGARNDTTLRDELLKEAKNQITGYHYRRFCVFLQGKLDDQPLFYTEIFRIGESFFKSGRHLDRFPSGQQLKSLQTGVFQQQLKREEPRWGGVFYYTLGRLRPSLLRSFPQELAVLYATGCSTGELINEFKFKAAYLFHRQKFPPGFLGYFLNQYLISTCKNFFAQNHPRDYFRTYFLFLIQNTAHLNRTFKKSLEQGLLRLK